MAAGWPYQATDEITQTLFADDGHVVVVERDFTTDRSSVLTLDGSGHPLPGWPWSPEGGSAVQDAAFGPDGSLYLAVRPVDSSDASFPWSLHRLSREGQEEPGFPVPLPKVTFCDLDASAVGIAYVTCQATDDVGDVLGTTISATRPDGSAAFATPVSINGDASLLGFGADDLPILAISRATNTVIRALGADGATRWSTAAIPGDAALDPNGLIRVTRHQFQPDACGAPTRTSYDVVRADGGRPAGWPRSIAGWSSLPAVLDDGSMVVVSAGGQASRYSLAGQLMAGWPVRGIDVSYACSDGSRPATDGRDIVVVGSQRVTALGPGGQVLSGWPANPPGENANACPGCTPGNGATIDPILGEGPVTYVATYDAADRPRVATIDAGGSIEHQIVVGGRGARTLGLLRSPDGRVWAVTTLDTDDTSTSLLSLVADPPSAP